MGTYRFHTPDGLSDMLPEDCAAKRGIEGKLRQLFSCGGYREIETPGIEFFDVYAGGDFVAPENLYKLTDQEGRILSLRYDGTVPVARLAATIYKEEEPPLRFCYIGNMYRFRESGGGKQREFAQAGVELLGAGGAQADAEVIALSIASALELGLTDLQISIGQVDFFRGLMDDFGINGEDAVLLSQLVDRKDSVMLEKMAARFNLSEEDQKTLSMIPTLFGKFEILELLASRVKSPKATAAIENLREILSALDDYGYLKYVSVDLGMLRGLDYYTGMIFKGYTHEVGFPIISGGRYDKVVSVFGRDLSAVGFSIGITLCIAALHRQGKAFSNTPIDVIVGFEDENGLRKKAIDAVRLLRKKKMTVILDVSNKQEQALFEYAKKRKIQQVIFLNKCDCGKDIEEILRK
ncbi:MAG TPA: ATP phosphoribosyltransferase regulatory subunit [Clostridiaceae bacterium]|nr:ATP phosphoribosyltransferase regulatory subunit [Clostridiaceae bacterium]